MRARNHGCFLLLFCSLVFIVGIAPAYAEDPQADEPPGGGKFTGWGFGPAIGISYNFGADKRVSEAQVVDGKVRVTKEALGSIGYFLELHYFTETFGSSNKYGQGWFVVVGPTSDGLNSMGFGHMWGQRTDGSKSSSLNIGVGMLAENKAKTLGDGIKENEALPSGETSIRYKEKMQFGLMILASFSF